MAAAKPVRVCVELYMLQQIYGDFMAAVAVAELADRKGVDFVSISDHVIIHKSYAERDTFGARHVDLDAPWPEPIVLLSYVAARTRSIRLTTGVMIASMRHPALLAKQLATLDYMSGGRLEIGLGIGSQKVEFDAMNIPFEGRYGRFDELLDICTLLWTQAPADYEGRHNRFADMYSLPFPRQPGGVPIWLGLKSLTEKNLARIARYGQGWIAASMNPDVVIADIRKIKDALVAHGRDPEDFEFRAPLPAPMIVAGRYDLDGSFAQAERLIEGGATVLTVAPSIHCENADQVEELIDRLVALKHQAQG